MTDSHLWCRRVLTGALLVLLALVGWWLVGQARGAWHWRAGKAALEADECAVAREHFAHCVATWPTSGEVRFLAARAARRCGELAEAVRQLDAADERGWVQEALDLERSLVRAQAGELSAVEKYRTWCLTNDHPDSALILEVLAPAYLQRYRMDEARQCVTHWLELRPRCLAAWMLEGDLAERRRNRTQAIAAYEQAVEIAPACRAARLALARLLVDFKRSSEALPHLEKLAEQQPGDAEVSVQRARCEQAEGRAAEAARLLDEVLAGNPRHAQALCLRGALELQAGRAEIAAGYLRKAVQCTPFDREALYNWLRCLHRMGKPDEVVVVEQQLKRCDKDLAQLARLTQKIAQCPDDPELRRQAGEVFLRNEQEEEGIRWLQSALAVRPDHPATHRSLGIYYQRKGQPARAAAHRARAERGQP
jgi:tetratricopeptide (TPR) repeat protein